MQELNMMEVDEVGGGLVFLAFLAPYALELAIAGGVAGVTAVGTFLYLKNTGHSH